MESDRASKDSTSWIIFSLAVLACFIIGYWPAIQKMSLRWSGGDNNYCYLVIPLFLYLCWDRRIKPSADRGLRPD